MKSAISVLEESFPRRRMRRSVAVRIRELHGRAITVIAHQARLVVSLAVLLVTIGTYAAAVRADEATYEPSSVRDAVPASTGGRQESFWYELLSSQRVHLAQAPAPVSASSKAQVTAEQLAAEREFWASVKASDDPADIRAYLEQFPGGMFEALARNWLKRLEKAAQPQAAQVTAAPAVPTQKAATVPSPSPESVEEALRLTRAQRMLVQRGLTALGFDVGAVDGIFGARTRAGIGKWQSSLGDAVTGFLDAGAAERLLKAGEAVPPEPQRKVVREAMELLSEALSSARRIKNSSDRAEALASIAEAQASAGDTRGARRTVAEALTAARSVEDAWLRAIELASITEAQASAGDTRGARRTVAEALTAARSVENAYYRHSALRAIPEAQASAGDIQGALSIARNFEDAWFRAMALAGIAEAQASAGDTRGAQRTVSEALPIARSVEYLFERGFALCAIAEAQASAGDTRGAQRTVSEALPIVQSTEGASVYRAAELLSAIAEAQASAGDTRGAQRTISEALPIARSLESASRRGLALRIIAEAQASTGDIQSALAIARSVPTVFERATALATIVQNKFLRTQERRDDEFVATTTSRPSSTQNQQATKVSSESSLWGAFVLSSDHSGQSRRMNYAVAWNYPSRKAAIAAAADRCATKARRGNCGGGRVYYTEDTGYVTYVAFSTTSQRHDLSTLNNQNKSDKTHLFTGLDGDQRGKSIVLRRRCALVWSELDTTADYANTPVVVFADSESRARAEFKSVWSKSANVSENWRNELTIYRNDQ